MTGRQLRWGVFSVLILSSSLNYLDRHVISALMPTLRSEFGISGAGLGNILAAFSITYAVFSPLMGLLIDRIGLRWGVSFVVGLWSLVGMGTGFAGSLGSLMFYRAMLGVAESGGIPATSKGSAVYLEPRDRALGSAVNQIGITIGTIAAPVLTELLSARFGWRSAFVFAGMLGILWIPIWLWSSASVTPAVVETDPIAVPHMAIIRDGRFWTLIAANIMAMTVYSLWSTWTTDFLVSRYRITQADANLHFAWIPPIFATVGGLFGGFAVQRAIRNGKDVIVKRLRICMGCSLFVLATALAPIASSPGMAILCVCISLFGLVAMSVNYYAIPLDLFGANRAAFAVSLLTSFFGLMNTFLFPLIGRWSDRSGWGPVCLTLALLPLLSALLLRRVFRPGA